MATKQKQAKRRARSKRLTKAKNRIRSAPKPRFYLAVKLEEGWRKMMTFRKIEEVDAYVEAQEDIRRRNASDIVPGQIIEIKSGKVIRTIEPHTMDGPDMLKHHRGRGKRKSA